ncbi:Hypothetical protein DHA2_150211 [Giardia duodenalis]|uniref:Uncharacterized protein n=1 Tax=Giardia intestinalis TaxID=5741 RepID=V6TIW0_GIAIN|nr:Hypothetical protein DHA2_150211 [Giardia intestinalis]
MPPRTSHPLARRGQPSSGTGRHPLFRVLRLSRRSGLHVARALVFHDEDPTPRPRVPTPFLGCLFVSSWRAPSVPSMIGGCAPRAPLSWSHSTRSRMPMECSHALCRGRSMALCSWIAVRSCRCSVTQRETVSTLTLCSASGSVMCGLRLSALHCTLG